eukprot:1969592-Rhodomonas_salina.1
MEAQFWMFEHITRMRSNTSKSSSPRAVPSQTSSSSYAPTDGGLEFAPATRPVFPIWLCQHFTLAVLLSSWPLSFQHTVTLNADALRSQAKSRQKQLDKMEEAGLIQVISAMLLRVRYAMPGSDMVCCATSRSCQRSPSPSSSPRAARCLPEPFPPKHSLQKEEKEKHCVSGVLKGCKGVQNGWDGVRCAMVDVTRRLGTV